jgi:hypothetical protein
MAVSQRTRRTVAVRITRISADTNQYGNYCYTVQSANIHADNIRERDEQRLVWSNSFVGELNVPCNAVGVLASPSETAIAGNPDLADKVYLNINDPMREKVGKLKSTFTNAKRMAKALGADGIMDKAEQKVVDILFATETTTTNTNTNTGAGTGSAGPKQEEPKVPTELELAQAEWDNAHADLKSQYDSATEVADKEAIEDAIAQLGERPA